MAPIIASDMVVNQDDNRLHDKSFSWRKSRALTSVVITVVGIIIGRRVTSTNQ